MNNSYDKWKETSIFSNKTENCKEQTKINQALCKICGELLEKEVFTVNDCFLELGGKNISTRVIGNRLREEGFELPESEIKLLLFKKRTLKENQYVLSRFIKPPVISYSYHANMLGVILVNKEAEDWFAMHYIYQIWNNKENLNMDFMINYESSPFIIITNYTKKQIECIKKQVKLEEFIKENIRQGNCVNIMVDWYYIPDQIIYYHKEHYMHELLITGYDEETSQYITWGFFNSTFVMRKYKYEDLVLFESEQYYGKGICMNVYESCTGTYNFNKEIFIKSMRDYYNSTNVYLDVALWTSFNNLKEGICGFNCYKKLKEHIVESVLIDLRYVSVFYEHKKCMYMRMKYINKKKLLNFDITYMVEGYKRIQEKFNKLLHQVVKFNLISYKMIEKRTDLKRKIVDLLDELEQEEKVLLSKFL